MNAFASISGARKWTADVLCREAPDDFFPKRGQSALTARRLCGACKAQESCLDEAMVAEDGLSAASRFGVWGGMTPGARARLDRQRKGVSGKASGGGRPLAPCGTKTAVQRHERRGEDLCPDCKAWREQHPAKKRAKKAKCGTNGGYFHHIRNGTPTCSDCRAAHRKAAAGT
jgi:WhiB family redox-sensing transcriptional regulator